MFFDIHWRAACISTARMMTNIANLNDDLDKNGNGERNTEVRVDSKTTVLVANAFPLVRNSIKDLLESTPNVHVIGCAKTKDEVLTLVELHHPPTNGFGRRSIPAGILDGRPKGSTERCTCGADDCYGSEVTARHLE